MIAPTTTAISTMAPAAWIARHDTLPVVSWDDGDGFDPRSDYVETYWLSVLGPSSILALRRLTDWLEDNPSGIVIALEDLALSLGLGHGTSRHSAIVRTLDRLVGFGVAKVDWDAYAVRSTIPALTARQLRRLPAYLAERHDRDLTALRTTTDAGRKPLHPKDLNCTAPASLRPVAHLNEGSRPR